MGEDSRFRENSIAHSIHEAQIEASVNAKWPHGRLPYLALLSGFCGQMNCWGLINSFGAFFRYYDEQLLPEASGTTLGLIGSVQSFFVLLLSVFVGRLLDAQLHRSVVAVGGVLTTLGYLCLSFTSGRALHGEGSYSLVMISHGITAGIGMSCFFVHSSHCVIQWFPGRKYFAVGITSCGAAVGGLAYPLAINYLIEIHGFPNGVRLLTFIIGGVSAVCVAFGGSNPAATERKVGPLFCVSTWIDTNAFRNPLFIAYTAAVCLIFTAYYPLLFYVPEWAEQERFKNVEVAFFLTIMNGCSVVGRLGSAWLASSRKANPILVHAISCIASALLVFLFWPLAQQESHALAFCVLVGVLGGALFGLPASGIAFLLPVELSPMLGVWTGMMLGMSSLSIIGPPVAGALVEDFGISSVGIWAGSGLLVAGILISVAMRIRHIGRSKGRDGIGGPGFDLGRA